MDCIVLRAPQPTSQQKFDVIFIVTILSQPIWSSLSSLSLCSSLTLSFDLDFDIPVMRITYLWFWLLSRYWSFELRRHCPSFMALNGKDLIGPLLWALDLIGPLLWALEYATILYVRGD